jgi:hypothetical protein
MLAELRAADPRFEAVADTLLALTEDDSVSPAVYDRVCSAVFTVLDAWAEHPPPIDDPRFGEPISREHVASMAVVLKALVLRAGGRVELPNEELEAAQKLCVMTSADPELLVMELVDGPPPDTPRLAAEGS